MEEKELLLNKLTMIFMIATIIVAVFSMTVMLTYASKKTIIVTDEVVLNEEEKPLENFPKKESWTIDTKNLKDPKAEALTISLPGNVYLSDVSFSQRFDTNTIKVKISNTKENYFIEYPPRGLYEHVVSAVGDYDGKDTTIIFKLDECCYLESSYEDRQLKIKFVPVTNIDKPIVMIDPGHGGTQYGTKAGDLIEKDILLKIGKYVENLAVDKPYCVLLTRSADETMSTEARINAVNVTDADYFIGLHLALDVSDVKKFGMKAYYNPTYYHNGLENTSFSDIVLRHTAKSTLNLAEGIFEAGDEEIALKVFDIPATYLYVGYISNDEEAKLLSQDEYLRKIAQGIVEALDEVIK